MTSHLDYCNSLLFGVPKYQSDRLQKVLKAAARLIFRLPKFNHILSTLFDLHWLFVVYRSQFKLLLLVYKAPASKVYCNQCASGTRAFSLCQEPIIRPLVIAPLPALGHFSGTKFLRKYGPVRILLFLNQVKGIPF